MELKHRWEPEHTDYSICLVSGRFAAAHGGECDYYDGSLWGSRESAQAECDRRNARAESLGRDERFEVREHHRKAGPVLEGRLC